MGRPARKLEARDSVDSRIAGAIRSAFGSPEVKIARLIESDPDADPTRGVASISLGMIHGGEVWLDLPIRMRLEEGPPLLIDDEDDAG